MLGFPPLGSVAAIHFWDFEAGALRGYTFQDHLLAINAAMSGMNPKMCVSEPQHLLQKRVSLPPWHHLTPFLCDQIAFSNRFTLKHFTTLRESRSRGSRRSSPWAEASAKLNLQRIPSSTSVLESFRKVAEHMRQTLGATIAPSSRPRRPETVADPFRNGLRMICRCCRDAGEETNRSIIQHHDTIATSRSAQYKPFGRIPACGSQVPN